MYSWFSFSPSWWPRISSREASQRRAMRENPSSWLAPCPSVGTWQRNFLEAWYLKLTDGGRKTDRSLAVNWVNPWCYETGSNSEARNPDSMKGATIVEYSSNVTPLQAKKMWDTKTELTRVLSSLDDCLLPLLQVNKAQGATIQLAYINGMAALARRPEELDTKGMGFGLGGLMFGGVQ